MKLKMLGTGTLYPEAGRASAGLVVSTGGVDHAFDLGRGVVNRMAAGGIDPLKLEHVYLSHLHPDHTCDLVPLLFGMNYAEPQREAALHLTAPEGFNDFFEHLRRAWRWLSPTFPFHVREAEEGTFEQGGATIKTALMDHGTMADLAFRIEADGGSVVYTGDTGPNEALLSLARGARILISECSLPDSKAAASHMSPTRLGQVAAAAECEKLVVTHIYPGTDPAEVKESVAKQYRGEVILAEDGLEIDV